MSYDKNSVVNENLNSINTLRSYAQNPLKISLK